MPAAMLVDNPNGSHEIYEGVGALLGVERPAGGIGHLAGPSSKGGWSVIEVWESEEDAGGFLKERLLLAPEVVGVPAPQPEFWPVQPRVGQRTRAEDVRILDAGHVPWLKEPARVVAEIAHFLATKQRSGEEAGA
jgi:hypothetical protein